jgi:hypothetical protein
MSIAITWGTSPEERAAPYPCDALVPGRRVEAWRGIDVAAPPAIVFRWLCQLRVAPYSYDWIDNFGRRSPRALTSGLDDLAIGQTVMRIFDIASFEAPRELTIVGNRRAQRWFAAFGQMAVTYRVVASGDGSRLLAKVVAAPRGPLTPIVRWLLPWGDWIMMRKQLRTLRDFAEREATSPPPPLDQMERGAHM